MPAEELGGSREEAAGAGAGAQVLEPGAAIDGAA